MEHARVNIRTRLPDPGTLTANIDPPQFTPLRKEAMSLPSSHDPSFEWVWKSKWALSRNEGQANQDGWRFAQRWDIPREEWTSNPATLSPISRSGLVSERYWVRIMKRCPVGQPPVDDVESSENEVDSLEVSKDLVRRSNVRVGATVRGQPTRTNSMGARLVNLVAGTTKGK